MTMYLSAADDCSEWAPLVQYRVFGETCFDTRLKMLQRTLRAHLRRLAIVLYVMVDIPLAVRLRSAPQWETAYQ